MDIVFCVKEKYIHVDPLAKVSCFLSRWYKLQHRPNKTKKDVKDRGEIDVSVEVLDNNLEYLCLDDVSEVIGHSVRAKRSSTLPVMSPGNCMYYGFCFSF